LSLLLLLTAAAVPLSAQVKTPRASQLSTLTQTIGVTEATVKYSRPGVKGREIWGALVPYDEIWRAGANEATTIAFTDTVKVEGQTVPPGRYGLAAIPTKNQWTVILHSKPDMEGVAGYQQTDDVARLAVTPQVGEHQEWMRFSFEDLKENAATLVLAWEKLRIPVTIETPTFDLVMRSARSTIAYQPPMQAASYLLGRKTDLAQALTWVNYSLAINENYWNLRVKAQVQDALGERTAAVATMERAVALGAAMKNAPFDFSQMKQKLEEWKK
jgi:hypothetical protein